MVSSRWGEFGVFARSSAANSTPSGCPNRLGDIDDLYEFAGLCPRLWEERRRMIATENRARYPDLAGQTVFVSGGGSGIGAAFVRCFAAQGCKVAFIDIPDAPPQGLASALGAPARYCHGDGGDIEALR